MVKVFVCTWVLIVRWWKGETRQKRGIRWPCLRRPVSLSAAFYIYHVPYPFGLKPPLQFPCSHLLALLLIQAKYQWLSQAFWVYGLPSSTPKK